MTDVPRQGRTLLGILFMCVASSLSPVMLALVRVLSPRYGAEQLVWARQFSQLIVLVLLLGPALGAQVVRTNKLGLQMLRSVTLLASTLFLYFGAKFLPLAKTASISLLGPFFVALLARSLLGERVSTARRWAIAIGFGGALLIIRPGSETFHVASLLIVGAALCYALFQILTRLVGTHDKPETSAIFSVLIGAVVLSFYVPFVWRPVTSWFDGALMVSLGVLGALGHYCLARALVYAPANVVAPFVYWQLASAVVVDYVVSRSLPDLCTSVGAGIIVVAGLVLGWRETRERDTTAPVAVAGPITRAITR